MMVQTMPHESTPNPNPVDPLIYQIRIKGLLDREWTDWFDGLTVTPGDDGETLITGPVRDQAALYGLLKKVRDLGIPLISVNCVEIGGLTHSMSNGET
ncbi:MAG TPA: hypothetical protein VMP08_15495 [Anaerolineae bacterium]|nr:hypothetical protein [Anaerolineae bacterium]